MNFFWLINKILANVVTISYGSGLGWLSPSLKLLKSNDSPLESGALTVDEISWIGSIFSIGAIVGNIAGGYLTTKIGSKSSVMLLGVPQLVRYIKSYGNMLISIKFIK